VGRSSLTPLPIERSVDPLDPIAYLPVVDGLRAVAILAVVAYHVGIPGLPGGFVGVDVFFVISGFLIIGQIRTGLERGHFTFGEFYARRALRILPPFLLVLLACLLIAPFILASPSEYEYFVLASVLAPIFCTNIYFSVKQGYFDIAADQKPLLHTWTLSVEEQFYLVTPILLFALFRLGGQRFGRTALFIGVALFLLSLGGALAYSTVGGTATFYLAHWRAWEFIAGGFAGAVGPGALRGLPRSLLETLATIGFAAIVLAVALIHAAEPYPSWRAVVPVVGATLVILAGRAQPGKGVARLLSTRPMVGIGLVSYSWYLWHWPVLSFLRLANFGEHAFLPDLAAGALSLVLAIGTYFYLEVPVRAWRQRANLPGRARRIILTGSLACAATVAVAGIAGALEYWNTRDRLAPRIAAGEDLICGVSNAQALDKCRIDLSGLIIGDSHAGAIFGVVARRYGDLGLRVALVTQGGCNPANAVFFLLKKISVHNCDGFAKLFDSLTGEPSNRRAFVIVDARWNIYAAEGGEARQHRQSLRGMLTLFQEQQRRVLLIAPTPEFLHDAESCVLFADRYGIGRQHCDMPRKAIDQRRAAWTALLHEVAAPFPNARVIDPIDLFCDRVACRPYSADLILFRDDTHVSPAGAELIYRSFAADFAWVAESD
jgi:peptidoglycan/LPS O-acetylase OafA/YrhL